LTAHAPDKLLAVIEQESSWNPWAMRTSRPSSEAAPDIHRRRIFAKIPPDIVSHKLYYVNYKMRLTRAAVDALWISLSRPLPLLSFLLRV